ncbi:MAG: hypothetical protein VX492_02975 [Candidatus Thermoplasmatota archaeon]|nr:hypothetical protein [Candidatus Thermoplasmatota archaeon]
MDGPAYWGIAGSPISHSLTPRLFSIVGTLIGIKQAEPVFIESTSIEEFESQVSDLEGDLWLSCTAPLKHSPQTRLGISGPEGVNAINQLMRSGGEWSGTSTDGRGFVSACLHFGLDPEGSVLRMRGGGSAARSIAAAWSSHGGSLILESGRRDLVSGPWDGSILGHGHADLAIDLDASPAGGASVDMDAKMQVSISYGSYTPSEDFAVVMVAAQHLEAWKSLFAPSKGEEMPSLQEVLSVL